MSTTAPYERRKTMVVWTPELKAALEAKVAEYKARDAGLWPYVRWDKSTVSEDILRQALMTDAQE